MTSREDQYVGPFKLEKTLGKGQTGRMLQLVDKRIFKLFVFDRHLYNLGRNTSNMCKFSAGFVIDILNLWVSPL